jgi:cyclopropane fatty-acyl-phospholipid synthase-like methyltransferase
MDQTAIYEDGTYLENNPTWHQQDSPWKARNIARLLKDNGVVPATICEIGCGAGEILNCLANDYGDAVTLAGYDISPQAYELCRKKERRNLHFHLKDLLDEDIRFDVVMAIDVFEHVEDYFGFLRRLRERGTYKVLHIPLDLSVQTVLRGAPIMKYRQTIGHIQYFTKETALATLRDTGYEVIDHRYTSGSLELSNRGWKANLMKIPRRIFFSLNRDLAVRVLGGFSLLVLAK